MDTEIRILIVEDNPADAELNKREVLKVLKQCSFEVVETEPDFLDKLNHWQPHLVVTDYTMPSFDGMTALSLTLRQSPGTPVIIVTGSVNEDTAIDCMKAGATHYVIKQNLKRLGPAILHSLDEREHFFEIQKNQKALRESELRFRNLFDLSPVGILVQDAGNIITDANESYCSLTGYSQNDLIGKHISLIVPENDRHTIDPNTLRILNGETLKHEAECIRKDHSVFYIELTESKVALPDGSFGIMSIANDITSRVIAQEKLKQQAEFQERLMEAIPIPVFYKDKKGIYQGCNQEFEKFIGLSKQALIGKSVFELYPEQQAAIYAKADAELIDRGGIQEYEYVMNAADKRTHDVLFRKSTYNDPHGTISGIIGSIFDISERKAHMESLRQKNLNLEFISGYALRLTGLQEDTDFPKLIAEELKNITGALIASFSAYDSKNKTLVVREISAGPEVMHLIANPLGNIFSTATTPVSEALYKRMTSETLVMCSSLSELTNGSLSDEIDRELKRVTGINRFFAIAFYISGELFGSASIALTADQPDPESEVLKSYAYLTSVTLRRKRAEDQLKEREERLSKIINSSLDAMIIMDADANINLWNQSAEAMFGWSHAEVSGKNLHNLIAPERYMQAFISGFEVFSRTGEGTALGKIIELQAKRKNGEEFPVELAISAINIENSWFSVAAVRDITSRKINEQEIIRSEKRYHDLFEANKDGILIAEWDAESQNHCILEVNEAAALMVGYTRQEMIGRSLLSLEGETPADDLRKRRKYLETNGKLSLETSFVHKSGHLITGEVSAGFIQYDGKKSLMMIVRDISDRKYREKLQKVQYDIANAVISSESLSELYEAVRTGLSSLMDTTNFFIAFYDAASGMMNAPFEKEEKETLVSWPAQKSLTGQVVLQNKTFLLKRADISEMAEKGTINLLGTRSEAWLGVPLISGKKAVGAMVVQSYDNPEAYNNDSQYALELVAHELGRYIERKEAEQNALKLSKAVEQNPVSIVITDNLGSIEYVNPKFSEITGYTREEAIGRNPNILKSGHHGEAFYKQLWDTITQGKDWQGEMKNRKKDGTFYWENAIISPLVDEEGRITNFVAVKEDITEKKIIIEELESAKQKAEESDRLKTAFLQNISHEIRTPLNGILGFSELLIQDWTTPEERLEYNEAIQISGKRLIEIISNVLDISIIETGQIILTPEKFRINSLLHELYNFYRSQAEQKKIEFTYFSPHDDEHSEITADQVRIHQILTNLLNNAFKYTKQGTIHVGYHFGQNEVIFEVSDTGIGIEKIHHAKIFTRFYQADHSSARSYEGAGLGLSISHGLVSAMGGKIWFESEPDKGSVFSFSIPVTDAPVPEHNIKTAKPEAKQRKAILIADDDDTSYMLLLTTLKKRNVEVLRATTGVEAIELFRSDNQIVLVFMDVKMPEMNGLEATRIIKSLKPEMPVIIQTAYAFMQDIDQAKEAGCDNYLSKPISTDKLFAILDQYLGKQ